MKALLNFIPLEQKKLLLKEYIILISQKLLIFILIVTATFTVTLFGAQYLMKQEIDRVMLEKENSKVLINGDENATIESAITQLNSTTARLATIQSTYVEWTHVLQKTEDLLTPGISLNSLSFNYKDKMLSINGTADTRESYFVFEESLNESPYTESVSLPLSLLKENIPFNVSITLSDEFFSYENK